MISFMRRLKFIRNSGLAYLNQFTENALQRFCETWVMPLKKKFISLSNFVVK